MFVSTVFEYFLIPILTMTIALIVSYLIQKENETKGTWVFRGITFGVLSLYMAFLIARLP